MEPTFPPINTDEPGPGPWDGYLVGPENTLAHSAVRELARGTPGISPLVLVGPAGSGKSRLLKCLSADRVSRNPDAAIAQIPGEVFVSDCHEAADIGSPEAWYELRRRYRSPDLLVLDDMHPLSRSPLALAELAPTIDELDASGSPVAISVRDDPGRWEGWPRRLADRLRGGLTVRLEPPGPATRRRFLLDRAQDRGLTMAADALDLLAEAADGYRTIEGWVARLALTSRVNRRPIDGSLANSLLTDDVAVDPTASISDITRMVASRYGVRMRDLRSSSRRASLIEPRHLAILLSRELTGSSYIIIGSAFGGRDPKSIRHACQAASRRIDRDPTLAAVADVIRRRYAPSYHQALAR
jgi:chromosomal replication initiator protein